MTDDHEIFPQHVLDHYEDPYHRGPLEGATHGFESEIPGCGDAIRIELQIAQDGTIREAWFDGDGCVASQAAASMLVEAVEGKSTEEAREFSPQQMLDLLGKDIPSARQKCCLLGWRTFQDALASPLDDDLDDAGPNFGGPSLSEEC